jgi:hypothetical protein
MNEECVVLEEAFLDKDEIGIQISILCSNWIYTVRL